MEALEDLSGEDLMVVTQIAPDDPVPREHQQQSIKDEGEDD